MIEAQGLTKLFGSFAAVDSIDFQIPAGQVVGFLGPNGAGKTTTIRMVTGAIPPTRGHVSINGRMVTPRDTDLRRQVGYLPESAPSYSEMRVIEYLTFRARLFGLERLRRKPAVDLALRRCLLEDVSRRPIHQLSKGYRQRVGLAAALLHEPAVLILDEPTVGLDPSQVLQFRALLRELRRTGKHTILLSTHILSEVEQVCDRVMMMVGGKIRLQGSLEEIRRPGRMSARFIVETSLPTAAGVLRGLQGVSQVGEQELERPWRRLTVTAASSDDMREAIGRAIQAADGAVRELRSEKPSLESLFAQVLEQSAESGPGAAP